MNRTILMMGLILSIAILATGTIVPNVEAKGKPTSDAEPTSGIKISCNDRKAALNCKASSRNQISGFSLHYYDSEGINQMNKEFNGWCAKTQPFGDPEIKSGTYIVTATECNTGFIDTLTITVVGKKITSMIKS